MVFTTQIFLFIFLPICLAVYFLSMAAEKIGFGIGAFLKRIRLRDLTLIALSLGFYAWSCFDDAFRLLKYITVVYLFALWIQTSQKKGLYVSVKKSSADGLETEHKRIYASVVPCVIASLLLVAYLAYYRYAGKFTEEWNELFTAELQAPSLFALLGLSFITFSSVSYLVDIYRGKAKAGSWIDCALYISFFPKIVSGPIVLWQDFSKQIGERRVTASKCVDGINRIIVGFAKKVILADSFGACIASMGVENIDRVTAAGSVLLYMLQIYYDFAGYSDIAIGLSKIFGFDFKNNFDFPYRSTSISEFWRRWHVSLGSWFREYIYFPCGGSRLGLLKTLRNLMIVFLLTGVWHGAGRTYLLWGIINGIAVVIERVLKGKKVYELIPKFIKYIFTMFLVLMLWNFFRFPTVEEITVFMDIIKGKVVFDNIYYTWRHYFDARMIVFTVIGILGATLLGSPRIKALYGKLSEKKWFYLASELVLILLFVVSVLFVVNSTYSPFIYFQY